MKKRLKLIETVVGRKTVESGGYVYTYTLIKRESRRISSFRIPLYSIKIELSNPAGEKTEALSHDLFSDLGKAIVFYDRLVRNLATPIDLAYVVEDEILR